MQTRLHLISPPWAPINTPSTQLGALQAYVERELPGSAGTRCYSAFLEILYRNSESACSFFYKDFHFVGEQIYMMIYCSRYLDDRLAPKKAELRKYLTELYSYSGYFRRLQTGAFGLEELERLEKHTLAYVDERVVPELIDDGVNVIGFTMNFNQVYASLVMARMIRERAPRKKILFLFGGFSASLPDISRLIGKLGVPGYTVFGEGEKRLVAILKDLHAQSSFSGELSQSIDGVTRLREQMECRPADESLFRAQVADLNSLPLPSFEEYFRLHDRLCRNDSIFERLVPAEIAFEGSRGCFAKCDFCNLNSQWEGFRKFAPEDIFERVRELRVRYGRSSIFFVDNVCDTWAEKFAELVVQNGQQLSYFMNLRAHHPERFWTKLAISGLRQCQIGIETLSAPLLRRMSKGTLLVQNLRVLKNLFEQGVSSGSGIITHHPKATEQDALETLTMLEALSHLDPLEPRRYALGVGSPLYNELGSDSRGELRPLSVGALPARLLPFVVSSGCVLPPEYELPESNARLWSKVEEYCRAQVWRRPKSRPVFNVERRGDILHVRDMRFGQRRFKLSGLKARLFDLCHEGLRIEMLEEKLGRPRQDFLSELEGLVAQRLILLSDAYYLTLATRLAARHELAPVVGLKRVQERLEDHRDVRAARLDAISK